MKCATIDIGTNSIRLLMANYEGGHFLDARKEITMTRLGKGVNETKKLDEDRMVATIIATADFIEKAKAYGAEQIDLMATSAVRDAVNGHELTDRLYEKTGFKVEVLGGEKEAEIGFNGVMSGVDSKTGNSILVIDIGGGSTELIVGDESGIKHAISFNVGAVRMTGAYVTTDPISEQEQKQLRKEIEGKICPFLDAFKPYKPKLAVGIGGTAATFTTIKKKTNDYKREDVHNAVISLKEIIEINRLLAMQNNEQRKQIDGLEDQRADIIYAGGIILQVVLESLGFSSVTFSDYDNLEGFMIEKK